MALGTRHIDYNGRLCMVSAGTAYKLAFGVDRSPNPWSDIPIAGRRDDRRIKHQPSAHRSPPITLALSDNGGKLIVIDPRMTPITRNADLYLPVRPGPTWRCFLGILHVILRDGLEKRAFIDQHTHRIR